MRFSQAVAALAALILAGTADAALRTRSLDAVRDEIAARREAFEGRLNRTQKRQKRAYSGC